MKPLSTMTLSEFEATYNGQEPNYRLVFNSYSRAGKVCILIITFDEEMEAFDGKGWEECRDKLDQWIRDKWEDERMALEKAREEQEES